MALPTSGSRVQAGPKGEGDPQQDAIGQTCAMRGLSDRGGSGCLVAFAMLPLCFCYASATLPPRRRCSRCQ